MTMQPELDIGPLTLQTFGIMFALGFVAAGALVARRLKELGKPVDWAYEMIFAALIGGVVGARVDWLIQNYDSESGDLLSNIFSGSGLVWFGGAVGGAVGVILWASWRRMRNLTLLDICAPGLAIGYAVGRIGCQLSGDGDYGIPWDGPWAMAYPDGTVPTDVPVHPTPIYETLAMGHRHATSLWRLRDALRPGAPVRALPGLRRGRAVPGRVHPPQRRGPARAHPAAALQPRDARRGRRLARREGEPRRALGRRRDPRVAAEPPRAGSGLTPRALRSSAGGRRRSGSRSR